MNVVPPQGTGELTDSAADKVLLVLSAFGERPEWELGALAAHLALPKSTTHRLLGALRRHGYARQPSGSSRYALGYRLARLAGEASPHAVLKEVARHGLAALAAESGETAFLLVSDGACSVCVDLVEPASPIRFSISPGTASPLHRGSSGLVLLAYESAVVRERAIARLEPEERRSLEAKLERVRTDGWAYTVGELTPGTGAISVPVLAKDGSLAGCLALGGPEGRLTQAVALALFPRLRERSAAMSASL